MSFYFHYCHLNADVFLQDMKRKIKQFAQRKEHSHYDSCVVAIMSHGRMGYSKQDSTIVAADGHQLAIDWVLEQFTNEKAPSLRARPKIFFFQTCRCVSFY
jgi:transposase